MERISIEPRIDWQKRVEASGFHHHSYSDRLWWDESQYVRFSPLEIELLFEEATRVYELVMRRMDDLVEKADFDSWKIPRVLLPKVLESWDRSDYEMTLLTRIDFEYDGSRRPRCVGISGDTPLMLVESAYAQDSWRAECRPNARQFNRISERLSQLWREYFRTGKLVHFSSIPEHDEGWSTAHALADNAACSGVLTAVLPMSDLGFDPESKFLIDRQGRVVETLVKFYPWSAIFESIPLDVLRETRTVMVEPFWKSVLGEESLSRQLLELSPETREHDPAEIVCSVWVVGGEAAGMVVQVHTADGSAVVCPHIF